MIAKINSLKTKTSHRRFLKSFGASSFPSTMLIFQTGNKQAKVIVFSFQSGNKAARSSTFLFCQSGNEAVKTDDFSKRGESGENR